ncbi:MAG: hypothetical protein EHM20_07395 [Alphaproteobacteria bacterium]|nr:MAG: hypothetical protein EHM20_07395 [Alphaproteobacteria bacterium]
MTITVLKHHNCGGFLSFDISSMFNFKTPSFSINPDGISLGVFEIQTKRNWTAKLVCSKCSKEIEVTDDREIEIQCPVCEKWYSPSKVGTSHELYALCTGCQKDLEKEGESSNPGVQRTKLYLKLPAKGVKFVSLAEVLKIRVSFGKE